MLHLQELLKDWPCTFIGKNYSIPITGITENSKNVKEGFLFIARKGKGYDGALYVEKAIEQGAVAIVVDRTDLFVSPIEVPVIIVADCRQFLSHASARFAGDPSAQLKVVAVTGTNGKTTVSHFIGQLLKASHVKAAVIGTLGVFIDGQKVAYEVPQMTTLPAEYLHPLLRDCIERGVTHIVLEASSLGLSELRLAHCQIDVGVLLNVSADHYDEHGGKLPYLNAKKKLITMAEQMICNGDDLECVNMSKRAMGKTRFFGAGSRADLLLKMTDDCISITSGKEVEVLPYLFQEDFNYLNATAAIGAMEALSFNIKDICAHLAVLSLPEGRMQRIEHNGVTVVIDYAHTPDALEVVLQSIARINKGQIITVFGCGGNRDKGKRKEMGAIATFYSSTVMITSDNPRNEDPMTIILDILEGFNEERVDAKIQIEMNREVAIQEAILKTNAGDVVLIAGKGHEKTQHIGDEVLPFSDLAIVQRTLYKEN